jgi:2-polyprenyl-3-methyl-5-hydroxy-6-metoxy-1,4-benzoquinol methylase
METIHFSSCPICGSKDIQYALSALDYTVSGESFQIMHCNTCTARFTQDIPTVESIARYYQSSKYISHTDTRKGIVNKMYHQVRKITLKQKRKLVEMVSGNAKGKLLDVGAGTGMFVQTMAASGWDVKGLEPDEGARKIAASSNILLADPSSLFSLEKNSFAVITLWHVLEHVHQLHEYIDQFHELLSPSGTLIIAVPNYTSHDAVHYGTNWAAYDVPRHLYHFSPRSMQGLLEKHHFTLRHVYPQWFDSYYVCLLSEQYKTGKMNLLRGAWQGAASNTAALTNKKRCSSLIYIAGKMNGN